jgi:hypothetical protein
MSVPFYFFIPWHQSKTIVQKPSSGTYNHVEVSGHNLEILRLEFLYVFLKTIGKRYGFLSGFPPFSFAETVRGWVSLKKYNSQAKL